VRCCHTDLQRIERCRHGLDALAAACRSRFALRFSLVPVVAFPWPFTPWWLLLSQVFVGPARHSVSCARAGGSHALHGTCRGGMSCVSHVQPYRTRKHGRPSECERCARPHEPQDSEESAGLTLGAGSVGEGFDWTRPARGPTWMVGRFRKRQEPIRKPPVGARPGP
jgi:hypothetical protein